MIKISSDELTKIMAKLSRDDAERYIPHINACIAEFDMTNVDRAAAFIAQIAHESCELRYFEEIASGDAYEGRKDLGNVNHGDGRRYKGRGPIQLTGRTNYRNAGQALGVDLEAEPVLAADPAVAFRVAGWFWKSHGLNELADVGDFMKITKVINGGYNGLASRRKYWDLALDTLVTLSFDV